MAALPYALITVTELKTYLGITSASFDALLQDIINATTTQIERYLGNRRIIAEDNGGIPVQAVDITELYDGGARKDGKRNLLLRRRPIIQVTTVSYETGTDFANPEYIDFSSATDFKLDKEAGIIHFVGILVPGIQNIRVIYAGGFSDDIVVPTGVQAVPDDLKLACKMLSGKFFNKRKAQGIRNESVGGGSLTWEGSVRGGSQDRSITDPEVRGLLDPYRSFNV